MILFNAVVINIFNFYYLENHILDQKSCHRCKYSCVSLLLRTTHCGLEYKRPPQPAPPYFLNGM